MLVFLKERKKRLPLCRRFKRKINSGILVSLSILTISLELLVVMGKETRREHW